MRKRNLLAIPRSFGKSAILFEWNEICNIWVNRSQLWLGLYMYYTIVPLKKDPLRIGHKYYNKRVFIVYIFWVCSCFQFWKGGMLMGFSIFDFRNFQIRKFDFFRYLFFMSAWLMSKKLKYRRRSMILFCWLKLKKKLKKSEKTFLVMVSHVF